LLRYTDHERAIVWLETVTPAMVRVRCKRVNDGFFKSASTVRVGAIFCAVESPLQQQTSTAPSTWRRCRAPAARSRCHLEAIGNVFPG
jgi:hypothetical protein